MVEVVNMRTCSPPWGQPGDVRIDRASKWGNPFFMMDESQRDKVCERYEQLMTKFLNEGRRDITELLDAKRLGCWCKPKRCHGDFLKARIEEALK